MIWLALALGATLLVIWQLHYQRLARQGRANVARSAEPRPATARPRIGKEYPCYIAGAAHAGPTGKRPAYIRKHVKPGDRLLMRREPDNPHDPNAVAFWHRDFHVGYVPARYPWVVESILEGDSHDVSVVSMEPSDDNPRVPFVTLTIRVTDQAQ